MRKYKCPVCEELHDDWYEAESCIMRHAIKQWGDIQDICAECETVVCDCTREQKARQDNMVDNVIRTLKEEAKNNEQ